MKRELGLLPNPRVGLGDFIAAEAARRHGLDVSHLADRIGDAARTAPATAVAWLLAEAIVTP
jgi:uncharacterized hydantoinase/oxoprolinase family protein